MSTQTDGMKKRQANELSRWQKLAVQPTTPAILMIILAIACLIRGLDEFASTAPGGLATSIVNEFFVKGQGLDFATGMSNFSLLGTITMPILILSPIYLILADRIGRKMLLTISVFGMALGLFLIFLSPNLVMHYVGRAVLGFFVATDVHQLYIVEIAPDNKRATWGSVNSFIGYLSMMLVSVSRGANTVNGELIWRNVFLVPVVIAIVLSVLLVIFGRETKPFLAQRIAFLSKTDAERKEEAAAAKKQQAVKPGNLWSTYKYIFTHKQPRNIAISSLLALAAVMAYIGYYEPIMTTSGMTTEQVTQALFVYPITSALFALAAGFIADRFGRKPASILYSVLAVLGLMAFVLTAKAGLNPYVVGLILGMQLGCFFSGAMGLSFSEVIPTEIRATSKAALGLLSVIISIISAVGISILVRFVELGTLCMIWGGVTVGLSTLVVIFTIKETKGADLEHVVSD